MRLGPLTYRIDAVPAHTFLHMSVSPAVVLRRPVRASFEPERECVIPFGTR
jgi:hypothetical protein